MTWNFRLAQPDAPWRGLTFIEILFAGVLLVVMLVPLGSLLSQASLETRASIDEFLASTYLTEHNATCLHYLPYPKKSSEQ